MVRHLLSELVMVKKPMMLPLTIYINAYNDRVRHFNNIYEEDSKASDAAAKIQDQINDLTAIRTLLAQAG